MNINITRCPPCSFVHWLWSQCVSLNLKVHFERHHNMKIGDTGSAKIAPTAAGKPSTVQSVNYSVAPPGIYSVTPADDGLSAALAAVGGGTGAVLTVTGVNVAGVTLSETAALPDVDAAGPPAADALNLTVTFP
jgi:hypothetical protein